MMPLGLKQLIPFDGAQLTDRAIDRAHQARWVHGTGVWSQCPCEEIIERGVSAEVLLGGLLHVHAVAPHKSTNQSGGHGAGTGLSDQTSQTRHRHLGHEVL